MSKKLRVYHETKEIVDKRGQKHTILVYGELEQTNEDYGMAIVPVKFFKSTGDFIKLEKQPVTFPFTLNENDKKRPTRLFNFGWAICDEEDKFDLEKGIKLAKKRFSDSPMKTTDVRFFSDDMIKSILLNEINFIETNLDEKFLHIEKETTKENTIHNNEKSFEFDKNKRLFKETHEQETVEPLPTISKELTKEFGCGTFIKLRKRHRDYFGVVSKQNGRILELYWILKEYPHGHGFETNYRVDLDEFDSVTIDNDEDYQSAIKTIKNEFGYTWDKNHKKLYGIRNIFNDFPF